MQKYDFKFVLSDKKIIATFTGYIIVVIIPFLCRMLNLSLSLYLQEYIYNEFKLSLNLTNIFFQIIALIFFLSLFVHRLNKDKSINEKGTEYINCPFWFLTLVGFVCSCKSINTVNVPIWLQFRIYLSDGWNTDIMESEYNLNKKNDKVLSKVKKVNHKGEVNVILMDTYDIMDKIPKPLLDNKDSIIVSRKEKNLFSRGYNQEFIDRSVSEINKIYKSNYNQINLFCSTNPLHTKRIVEGSFRVSNREKKIKVVVFQSVGLNHIYKYSYTVI